MAACGVLAAGQAPPRAPNGNQTVRVAAAADLKFALDEAIARRPVALRVLVTYGSSGSMHAQLRQRAPYDVFLSADADYPRDLVSRGIGTEGDLFTDAIGRLVVGSAPGWADPWSRARRGFILEVEPWRVMVRLDDEVWRLDRRDIQTVRIASRARTA